MCLCKFGQNPQIGSGDRVQRRSNADADVICTKSNMSPPPLLLGGHNNIFIETKLIMLWTILQSFSFIHHIVSEEMSFEYFFLQI